MGHGWHGCFWADSKQWGLLPNNTTVVELPISYTKFKAGVGIHVGNAPIIVIELNDYFNSLTQVGFSTFSTSGVYDTNATVFWITLGY